MKDKLLRALVFNAEVPLFLSLFFFLHLPLGHFCIAHRMLFSCSENDGLPPTGSFCAIIPGYLNGKNIVQTLNVFS